MPSGHASSRVVDVRRGVLEKNDERAGMLRATFAEAGLRASNWVSSPGSGKTSLLTQLLRRAAERGVAVGVLVGDCATDNDARRLATTGAPVRQIVTEGLCHLEADMVAEHVAALQLFASADLVVVTKTDLAAAVEFDAVAALRAIATVAPLRPVLTTSARTGDGVDALLDALLAPAPTPRSD